MNEPVVKCLLLNSLFEAVILECFVFFYLYAIHGYHLCSLECVVKQASYIILYIIFTNMGV